MGTALSSLGRMVPAEKQLRGLLCRPPRTAAGEPGATASKSLLSPLPGPGGGGLWPLRGAVVGIEALSGRGHGVPDAGHGGVSWSGQPGLLGEDGDGQLFS